MYGCECLDFHTKNKIPNASNQSVGDENNDEENNVEQKIENVHPQTYESPDIHKNGIEVFKKENKYDMKTSDHERKIEIDTVKNDTIFDDGDFTTINDREKEEKMDENYQNNNSKAKSHNDKQFRRENNNINTIKVFDNNIDNEQETKVNNDWFSSQHYKATIQGVRRILSEQMKAEHDDSLQSLPITPLVYVVYYIFICCRLIIKKNIKCQQNWLPSLNAMMNDLTLLIKIVSKIIDNPKEKKFRYFYIW